MVAHLWQRIGEDGTLGQLHRRADIADRLVGARGADGIVPAQLAVARGKGLERGCDIGQRGIPAFAAEFAVAEILAGGRHAAQLDTLALDGVQAAADDAFGRSTADVQHQPQAATLGWLGVGDAQIDQARLLAAGDHFDGMPERAFGRHQEGLRGRQLAHGIGGDRAHPLRRDVADALAKPRQASIGTLARLRRQAAAGIQPVRQANRLAQPVDHPQLTEQVLRHHHVETVGPQVDGGQHFALLQRQRGGVEVGHRGSFDHPHSLANNDAWAEWGRASSARSTRRYSPPGCSCQALRLSSR